MSDQTKIERAADEILERFIFATPARPQPGNRNAAIDLRWFGAIDPLDWWPEDAVRDDGILLPDVTDHVPPVWPLDISIACRFGDHRLKENRDASHGADVLVTRCMTAAPRDLRGKVRIMPRFAMRTLAAWMYPNGRYDTETIFCGLLNGRWTAIDAGIAQTATHSLAGAGVVERSRSTGKTLAGQIDANCRLACGFALTRRYQWMATLRIDDSPQLLLPTDRVGVREIFRLRDIPPGAARRAALLHWVSSHWRRKRRSAADDSWVRQHLRGRTECTWNGLHVEIFPAEFEIDRAASSPPRADTAGPAAAADGGAGDSHRQEG